ncbi:hypothetical protein K2173_021861 [Erythroxylum novogranatense]|uniref:non-specific serine/threonine protein kinase n=1 Tax=Erythroxylum novogranatense TaxID=1862640 RepID=A0AAV8T3L8_9ROSI|nr:hypothetical protein K2173_021861 [Erythroxylum novogranatense]
MGHCCSKDLVPDPSYNAEINNTSTLNPSHKRPPLQAPPQQSVEPNITVYASSPFPSPLPSGVRSSPTPGPGSRKFKWPLPPPSPAKPIMAIMRRTGLKKKKKTQQGTTPEGKVAQVKTEVEEEEEEEVLTPLDKSFGYAKNFGAKYQLGREIGRGHFGNTCMATPKKGVLKGHPVAVKIISKAKMTTAMSIEDVRREVNILKALSGHKHMITFHDAFEDDDNVYIVMELCEGGELLDRILARGGRYIEEDAKAIVVQILNVVAFCHVQGVVHRDLKPENFLFTAKDEDAPMKIIDFGLSDFINPDERLNDIVGSAHYVAPEVLHRSYNVEADMWSIGVITYILLCGSRPFWARTESGIFRFVLRANPNFEDSPWPSISQEAKDFVKRLLNKDHRKRMSAAQALTHPWLRDENRAVPLDVFMYKLVKSYIRAKPFKRAALKALSKAIPEKELIYLKAQFNLLEPKDGFVSVNNFRAALMRHVTDAIKEARIFDILNVMEPLSFKKLRFEEFCAAAISPYQLEGLEGWQMIAKTAFEYFEQEGNRAISVEELALEMNLGPEAFSIVKDWIRTSDGKLSFVGYTRFLHGVTIRNTNTKQR